MRPRRLGLNLVLSALLLAARLSPTAHARADEYTQAESPKPLSISLCQADGMQDCGSLAALAGKVEAALPGALAEVGPFTAPLLKRDQVWFRETAETLTETALQAELAPDGRDLVDKILRARLKMLEEIAISAGRVGVVGRWVNAFGTVEITDGGNGTTRVRIETSAPYTIGSEENQVCRATATVKAGADGWLAGSIIPDTPPASPTDGIAAPMLRLKRQAETLRVVAGAESIAGSDAEAAGCSGINQMTGTYFAAGGRGTSAAGSSPELPLVTPTFDCTKPNTADEEEICADPELAENDRRLNVAWNTLLPRLDAETKRLLKEDQRAYVTSQAEQYPEFLHPAWEKQSSDRHHTALGRNMLAKLQLERIALLTGFDEKRQGFEGLWISANAMLDVRREGETLTAAGWKWFQGDWKGGCEYSITGTASGQSFKPSQPGPNADTLEREHATLVVNRADDRLAPRRSMDDGTTDPDAGEAKCRRNITISSTARLFPVRASPDIAVDFGSIR
jgi:uncharacterized protein YecT (DUF1311 family)